MSYLRVISEVYLHVISESDIRSTYISYLRVISEVYLHVISESDIRGLPTCHI